MSFPTLFKSVIKSPVPWRCNFWDFLVPSIKTNQNLAKLFLPWNVRFLKTTSWGPLPFWLWEFVRFSFSFFFLLSGLPGVHVYMPAASYFAPSKLASGCMSYAFHISNFLTSVLTVLVLPPFGSWKIKFP